MILDRPRAPAFPFDALTPRQIVVELDRWQVIRLFVMPFCVSSFAALVKDEGYVLVFPPSPWLNAIGFALIAAFVARVLRLRTSAARAS